MKENSYPFKKSVIESAPETAFSVIRVNDVNNIHLINNEIHSGKFV